MTFLAGAAAGLAAAAALSERPALEQRVRERIQAEAFKRGLVARVDGVRVGPWPPVLLTGVRLEKPGQWSLTTDKAALSFRARGRGVLGRARLALGTTTIAAPAGLTLALVPTVWDVAADGSDVQALSLRQPATGLTLTRPTADKGVFEVRAEGAPLGSLIELRRGGVPLLDAGVVTGRLGLRTATDATSFDIDIQAHGMRMAVVDTATAESAASFGPPAEVRLSLAGGWHGPERRLEVTRWRMTTDGVSVSGSLSLDEVTADPRMDLAFEVERVDLARLLALSALDAPVAVAASVDDGRAQGSLGSASLSARVTGTLSDAASFSVKQELDFRPPLRTPPQIERLRRGFLHEVTLPDGQREVIDVSPASPDFVSLREVPPLLLQTLLLGEDAGFFGHGGIDLSELPSAILTNWSRGESARGASTITQQLAKNLFLSREKRLGRKLQEVALALLLESALGKERILEIYLNVIEWGPGLYGLRPAARQYFGKEPDELAPAQMALLVALIPGPLKYQRSLASGTPSPGFRPLVDRLLAKLRSVDALSDEQYYAALADDLRLTRGSAGE
jgi:hypothetical protein